MLFLFMKKIFWVLIVGVVALVSFLIVDYRYLIADTIRSNLLHEEQTSYAKGEIIVGFDDEVSYNEAINSIKDMKLDYEFVYPDYFKPEAFVIVPSDFNTATVTQIKQESNVIDVETIPVGKIKVIFDFGITKSQAANVLQKYNLEINDFFRFASSVVYVRNGKEKYYIDKFEKLPIIRYAELNYEASAF